MSPHDISFMQRETVHYIPDTSKMYDPAICGIRWINGSDKVADVTCPMCIEIMKQKGIIK